MKKETARALTLALGVLILLAVLGLGSAAWFFSNAIAMDRASQADAAREFDTIRARYAAVTPVLDVRDGEPFVVRRPPGDAPRARLETLKLIHWDSDDGSLTRVDLPFWFLRLKSGSIQVASSGMVFDEGEIGLSVEDLERLGPTLVLDHTGERGDRLIMWTE